MPKGTEGFLPLCPFNVPISALEFTAVQENQLLQDGPLIIGHFIKTDTKSYSVVDINHSSEDFFASPLGEHKFDPYDLVRANCCNAVDITPADTKIGDPDLAPAGGAIQHD